MKDKKPPELYIIKGDSEQPKAKATAKKRRLTAKQERFVSEVIKGATASDAYRTAYDVDKGKGMKASAIWTESSRLLANPMVAARLQSKREAIDKATVVSALSRRRWVIERLEHEAAHAESDAARVRSLELLGKTSDLRLFTEIVETRDGDASPDEVRAELEAKLTSLLSG
tara:strand:+ start:750 stop:1262 length:513 start_codon:yes stop_codon:yes gene_type:complete